MLQVSMLMEGVGYEYFSSERKRGDEWRRGKVHPTPRV